MFKIFHKLRSLMFAFVPWITFVNQTGLQLADRSQIKLAVSSSAKNCSQIERTFDAKLAISSEAKAKGLGGRSTPLGKDEAMLFVLNPPTPAAFWMKDTLIPLQITYFDTAGRRIKTEEMEVEKNPQDPKRYYLSIKPAIAVLETAPGSLSSKKGAPGILCVDSFGH